MHDPGGCGSLVAWRVFHLNTWLAARNGSSLHSVSISSLPQMASWTATTHTTNLFSYVVLGCCLQSVLIALVSLRIAILFLCALLAGCVILRISANGSRLEPRLDNVLPGRWTAKYAKGDDSSSDVVVFVVGVTINQYSHFSTPNIYYRSPEG